MIKELLYKWFGIEPTPCNTCEILRLQLAESNRERRELLHKLLDGNKIEPPPNNEEKPQPITPQFIPFRVRQQMLEAEDRRTAQLMKQKADELKKVVNHQDNQRITALEQELDVATGE